MELFNVDVVAQYWHVFLKGLGLTVFLTAVSMVLATALAIPLALGRLSPVRLLRWPANVFVEFMRATPLILQLIYIYYVLPAAGIRLEPITAVIIGLSLHYSAYLSEVFRGGIQSIPKGQTEAAFSLGLSRWLAFRKIVLPQATRTVLPTLGNYLISLFKDTSLASVVTVQELMFSGQIISARNFQYFTVYTITAILYFAVCYPSGLAVRALEDYTRKGWVAMDKKKA
ncbi:MULTISPECIES: amino acid ABC transporter permease [unclassified Mesorhizobium]|jgi:polar amino acid transport system permease protein|uniref:amino acid ABC transporter permease n=1 Tax=unclassified Mesorhizobium TaxID=325217 RepID=UPI00086EA16F|nr:MULTISPECIES: amino acid ABC transporter permease [unclassified Mesorhizobium]MBN9257396.1 amino acid ABC transporter permease [Mesorhizobium sp.]MBN9269690.1 amino acid ABC transporter permease [Mesorhizobium sp.]ODT15348.1 MAG: amino acid ABC transporter permease [Mesorhizobium sp. SCN 65-12]OJX80499.1 MAG: amino acid ABC transporter permease [Mesorhizobium sp. 65-26]